MLTFQKSYKFHHCHHLNHVIGNLIVAPETYGLYLEVTENGGPQIIPKLNHVRKFSLETSIETNGFGDPFQEPPIFRYLSPHGNPQPAHGSRFGDVCHVGAYEPAVASLHHDPGHPYDDHSLVACNHEADSSSKIVMSVISGSNT